MDGDRLTAARWTPVADWRELERRGRLVVRPGGRQIALFLAAGRLHACDNRCPHEGYPLAEGTLSEGAAGHCLLTCNWHNWKFDLESGETLVGGDRLRRYPARREGERVLLDLAEPPPAERQAAALAALRAAMPREEYDRMARALARHRAAGGETAEALRQALAWTHLRLEFGFGHAQAAAPDWLALGEALARDTAEALVAPLEVVAHLAEAARDRQDFPYAEGARPWDATAFLAAIEAEDETDAVARVRGALAEGRPLQELMPSFARAALAHYADFGHSLIYCQKAAELTARLGPEVAEPLLLPLVRSLVLASREDLIPEFRAYAPALAAWDGAGDAEPLPAQFLGQSVKRALAAALAASGRPRALQQALVAALATQLLQLDTRFQERHDRPVSQNAGWLDVTHGLTVANAVRWAAGLDPALLAPGLLQMACFAGRNSGFVDSAIGLADWAPADPAAFLAAAGRALLDHRESAFILAAHRVKTLTAVAREMAAEPALAPLLAAALRRFLASPVRLKHPLRTARQALALVAAESSRSDDGEG